jgi:phosphoglycolate phosphatase
MVMRSHVIFDLDGTLVDSVPVSVAIMNAMLSERRAAMQACPDITRRYVSAGGQAMIAAVLGDYSIDPAHDIAEFRARYAEVPTPPDSLYPGVRAGLTRMIEAGLSLAVCTNKPQGLAEKVLADLGIASMFQCIIGSRPGIPRKPAPDLMSLVLMSISREPSSCLFVGDSSLDRDTATQFDMAYLMVGWGYGLPEELPGTDTAQHFGELEQQVAHWQADTARAA